MSRFGPASAKRAWFPTTSACSRNSIEVAPFAGATRNLCDRKEVTLGDQMGTTAKFYIYTPTHIASKFTGVITDDFTSEFDPFSPQFGEKFAPPDLPVSVKDWTGNEISRVYADHWGAYNGMLFSTWEVNPPNPTGYSPNMGIFCMNDPGPGEDIRIALFNPGYSQFCYELPFMPGTTTYLDTPVVPTSAFSEGYNHPDCDYPDLTPAIKEVDGDGIGPWVSASGNGAVTGVTVTNGGVGIQKCADGDIWDCSRRRHNRNRYGDIRQRKYGCLGEHYKWWNLHEHSDRHFQCAGYWHNGSSHRSDCRFGCERHHHDWWHPLLFIRGDHV